MRHLLLPWWNAYSFFITYANVDNWNPNKIITNKTNLLDKWIQSSLARLENKVSEAMDSYNLQSAVKPFVAFIEDLTNWYIRRSRRRFWKAEDDNDKLEAYSTLYEILLGLCKIAAPFTPFIAENIYKNLKTNEMPASVHLCDYPSFKESERDLILEAQMSLVMSAVEQGRALRTEYKLKNRQPLSRLFIVCKDEKLLSNIQELEILILDELNVKRVEFSTDSSSLATLHAKPNFKNLGPKLGPLMKDASSIINSLSIDDISLISNNKTIDISLGGSLITLSSDDIDIIYKPKTGLAVGIDGELVIGLDTELTDELINEGLAREFVNKVQAIRKDLDLQVTDRIIINYDSSSEVERAIEKYMQYIKSETLAVSCEKYIDDNNSNPRDINGHSCFIKIIPLIFNIFFLRF